MVMYQIESELLEKTEPLASREQSVFATSLQVKSEAFYQAQRRQSYIYVSSLNEGRLIAAAITKSHECIDNAVIEFLQKVCIRHSPVTIKEITLRTLQSLLRIGVRNRFVDDDESILERFNLAGLTGRFSRILSFEENILSCEMGEEDLIKEAEGLLLGASLVPEIKRIFGGAKTTSVRGHPVHYLIQTDSADVRDRISTILLASLLRNGRIQNRRYCSVLFDETSDAPGKQYDLIYESCSGGAIQVCLSALEEEAGEYASVNVDAVKQVCRVMRKHSKDVLTMFCLPRSQQKTIDMLKEYLDDVTLITLNEETVFGEQAKKYLRNLARIYHVRPNAKLYRCINDEGNGMLAADLNLEFDRWLSGQLKTNVYPQYSEFGSICGKANSTQPKGSSYRKLMGLIGLQEAKEMIVQALNYVKAQKLYQSKGMASDQLPMHMVFTGNPGTAKTTVARLYAQVMKDNGILRTGNLLEVGRADLVGKYVGWTSQMVRDKFKSASGSVLFIDEAYSLLDDREGMYGDEAINTIVQEMENRRDDMVVIFAGYPDRMAAFLNRNPGLRSRIGFHIRFPDYSAEELWEILDGIATEAHMILGPDVKDKLLPILRNAQNERDFGNGRYVRNLFDKARLCQASRIIEQYPESIFTDDMLTLLAEDFDITGGMLKEQSHRMIGFVQ